MDDVTLFKIGGSMKGPTHGNVNKTGSSTTEVAGSIEIKCKKCYLTTLAMAEIEVQSDSDNDTFSDILNDTVNNVIDRVNETVTETFDAFDAYFSNYHNWDDYADGVTENILEDGFDLTDLLPPNINVSSLDDELDLAIPATTITFRFEDLDLYLELETKLKASATYTLKLMPSGANPVGIELPNNINFGVIFSVDLILAIDGELDITGGLHVKVDDHVAMRLELFGDKVSDMSLEGGHVELLPVTVQSATASFTATLRLGAKAAMTVGNVIPLTDEIPTPLKDAKVGNLSLSDLQLAGGILMGVNADVAVFKTSFELVPADPDCRFKVVQDYSLALGATAGAQVTVGTVMYGPAVATSTAVYTTTLNSYCVIDAAPTVTSTAEKLKRQATAGEYSTELTTTLLYSAIECPATVTGECPVSLQTTMHQIETTSTTVYAANEYDLPSEYPTAATSMAAITRIPLGTGAQKLERISGSPSAYTPGPTSVSEYVNDAVEAAKKHRSIAIGVGVGLGVPLLVLIGALVFFCVRRKKTSAMPKYAYVNPESMSRARK
ncbi:unnamed protein product [Zymoseptoria tritici ST99CH_1E4]|uniref:Mid2 domain-containing protein n=1 Tax=Zymoseptoria tritici ST99CH_1E4 TaxID=1276532 RepID=A0A2H1FXU7_ZYMTR|nr:unnamed protein product [Zymoseptoria tritici ST99CH_1E4]